MRLMLATCLFLLALPYMAGPQLPTPEKQPFMCGQYGREYARLQGKANAEPSKYELQARRAKQRWHACAGITP
jgi:hypothetical protein